MLMMIEQRTKQYMARKPKEYTNKWKFQGIDLECAPENSIGFVYILTDLITGKRYIGKKSFYSVRKLKPSDKRRTRVASDWKHYYSSSPTIKQLIKEHGNERFSREILAICTLDRDMNYLEVKYQFQFNVLENPDLWYNENINGNWYPHLYVDINTRTQFSN